VVAVSTWGAISSVRPFTFYLLLYAVGVIPATKSDISMLNHVIDRTVFKIFRCDDVKYVRSAPLNQCVQLQRHRTTSHDISNVVRCRAQCEHHYLTLHNDHNDLSAKS